MNTLMRKLLPALLLTLFSGLAFSAQQTITATSGMVTKIQQNFAELYSSTGVNAAKYGVDCTGATDSATALQAAATAAYTDSGVASNIQDKALILPGCTIKINSAVTIKSSVVGNGTVILLGTTAAQLIIDRDGAQITNFKVVPGFVGTGIVPAIEVINYRAFVAFRDIFISEVSTNKVLEGIKANVLSTTFDNVRVAGASTYGIHLYNVTTSNPNATDIIGCRVRDSGTANYYIENAVSGTMVGNVSEGTAPIGIYLKGSAALTLVDNHVEGTGSGIIGIKIENADQNTLIGGYWSPLTAGTNVQIINSDRTTLVGHQYSSSGTGVSIDATSDSTFFSGGYIQASQISNSGTNTRMNQGNGHNLGSVAEPAVTAAADSDTGFLWTSNSDQVYLSRGGVLDYTFGNAFQHATANPRYIFDETDQGADERKVDIDLSAKTFTIRSRTDLDAAGTNIFTAVRGTGTAWASLSLGNATNNPTFTWLGTGLTTLGGALTLNGNITQNSGSLYLNTAAPALRYVETDQGSDLKRWAQTVNGGVYKLSTTTDADGAGKDAITVTRGATTVVSAIALGNSSDNPALTFNGPLTLAGSGATTGAQTATFTATNKPGAGTGAPTIWIPVIIGGTTYWVPGFANGAWGLLLVLGIGRRSRVARMWERCRDSDNVALAA